MREVVIRSWCDECAANGKETEAEPIDIDWQGKGYSLDLCEDHAAPFHEVDRLVEAYGTRTKKLRKKSGTGTPAELPAEAYRKPDGTFHCPDCTRVFNRPQGLGAHRSRIHGYKAA